MKTFYALLISIFAASVFAAEPATAQKPATEKPAQVLLQTSTGDITLELDAKSSPKTVANFLQYVNEGFYNNTIFHRVIPGFMIQGGGFLPGMVEKPTHDPVVNESANGKQNKRATISMARTRNPDSATAQFFINLVDNTSLDAEGMKPGYAVFGTVTKGMDVVDQIAQASTGQHGPHSDVPVQDVLIISARQLP